MGVYCQCRDSTSRKTNIEAKIGMAKQERHNFGWISWRGISLKPKFQVRKCSPTSPSSSLRPSHDAILGHGHPIEVLHSLHAKLPTYRWIKSNNTQCEHITRVRTCRAHTLTLTLIPAHALPKRFFPELAEIVRSCIARVSPATVWEHRKSPTKAEFWQNSS